MGKNPEQTDEAGYAEWHSKQANLQELISILNDPQSSPEQSQSALAGYRSLSNTINELRNKLAFAEWRTFLQGALKNPADYLVVSIGSAGSNLQIYPPFIDELISQNKKVLLLNIDPVFDNPANRPAIEKKTDLSVQFIGHPFNSTDWMWTKPLETVLKKNINIIMMWHCNSVIGKNLLNFANNYSSQLGKNLTLISSYYELGPVLLANQRYIASILADPENHEVQQLINFMWKNVKTYSQIEQEPQAKQELLEFTDKFGTITSLDILHLSDIQDQKKNTTSQPQTKMTSQNIKKI